MLCIQMKVLCKQLFDFSRFQNLLGEVINFHNTAVFISASLFAGSKQKPCVILRTHGVRLKKGSWKFCETAHKYARY
jgi:hypothetical protein